mmetsp:Transcript_19365/g.58528  ORF Transcript_19365/g.58528 Transcript_19365/m.58528 type:complete len:374 (+) Transcript_19365:837-1958(+)
MLPALPLAVCCLVLTTSKGVVTKAARDAAIPAAPIFTTRISSEVGGTGAAGCGGGGGASSNAPVPRCMRRSIARASSDIIAPRKGSSSVQYSAAKGTSFARLDPKPVHMLVICWKRVVPGLLDSWLKMLPVLRLPWRPPFCILTRASSRGAVRKPATPRDVAPATRGAYAPAPESVRLCSMWSYSGRYTATRGTVMSTAASVPRHSDVSPSCRAILSSPCIIDLYWGCGGGCRGGTRYAGMLFVNMAQLLFTCSAYDPVAGPPDPASTLCAVCACMRVLTTSSGLRAKLEMRDAIPAAAPRCQSVKSGAASSSSSAALEAIRTSARMSSEAIANGESEAGWLAQVSPTGLVCDSGAWPSLPRCGGSNRGMLQW